MHHLVKSLQSKGKAVTPASIETESLFHAGGTVTREQASEYLKERNARAYAYRAKVEEAARLSPPKINA